MVFLGSEGISRVDQIYGNETRLILSVTEQVCSSPKCKEIHVLFIFDNLRNLTANFGNDNYIPKSFKYISKYALMLNLILVFE